MSKNSNFLEQVSSHFGKGDEVLVGCQSGGRSLRATAELLDAVTPIPTKTLSNFEALTCVFQSSFNTIWE